MAVVVGAVVGEAAAQDVWTDPHPGVRHLHRIGNYAYDDNPAYTADVVIIDLRHPAVSLHATGPDDRGGVVSDFAERNGLQVAWNTNFFSNAQTPCGMMVGGGEVWDNAYNECQSSLAVGAENQVQIFETADPLTVPEDWMTEIVSGTPQPIVVDGEATYTYGCGNPCNYHPRTGIGYDEAREHLIVVAVDGRSNRSVGAGLDDLANLLIEFGAHDAINLDGGGSTAMYVEGDGGIVNSPSDGAERNVCCHMGVRISEPSVWYAAELVQRSPDLVLRHQQKAEAWVEYRNVGRATWRAGGDHPVLLGTVEPMDRDSALAHESWLSPSRAVGLEADVPPGETGRFQFAVRGPPPETYVEAFAPVAEGAAWMDGEPARWDVRVTSGPEDRDAGPDTVEVGPDTAEPDVPDAGADAPRGDTTDDAEGYRAARTKEGCQTQPALTAPAAFWRRR